MREQLNSKPFRYHAKLQKSLIEADVEFLLNEAESKALKQALEPVLSGREVWLRLPEIQMDDGASHSWVFLIKLRPGESRALLAHPDQTEWVGTLALEHHVMEKLIDKLDRRESCELKEFFGIRPPSNINVKFTQE